MAESGARWAAFTIRARHQVETEAEREEEKERFSFFHSSQIRRIAHEGFKVVLSEWNARRLSEIGQASQDQNAKRQVLQAFGQESARRCVALLRYSRETASRLHESRISLQRAAPGLRGSGDG